MHALTEDSKQVIARLGGDRNAARVEGGSDTREIVLNETTKYTADNRPAHIEQIIFEMNAVTGKWRKLRRKLGIRS